MPSPHPSPTGKGAGYSGFRRCRSSEKEYPKYQRQEFFRQSLSQGRWNKRRERFFRRPLNPSVGCVPQDMHAVGWGCRENGERVRAYRTHPTCELRLAPPRGREQVAASFTVTGGLKSNLDLQPLISGRLKNKKQPAQPVFLAEPLILTAAPSSLPWERVRERATSRKACILGD